MPTYQYECNACGHEFDMLQSMLDKKLKKCPSCKKLKLVRLIGSGTGIIFKGTGFYETDYKRPVANNSEDSSSKSSETEKSSNSAINKTEPASSDTAKV